MCVPVCARCVPTSSTNSFGTQGAAALAAAIGHNSTLQELYVGFNRLTADGVGALKQAVADAGRDDIKVVF